MNFRRNKNVNLDQLVGKLQKEDAKYARLSRGLQIVYWIFIPLYTFLAINHYRESGEINDLIGGLCYVISFFIFAIFFGIYHKEYKYADYSLPTLKMLKNAAYRYQPVQVKSIWPFIAVLFMDAGLCLNKSIGFSFIKVQIYFLGAMFIAVMIGLTIWYFKYKPLRDNALSLIAEIEGE
ncbi:hypothetical protein EV201_1518 [Ancylomarina subtilis]|uniref:Uncharacterized protein n=1 Tax=Ancylomarina subtilis TaxID=1639035 RepID=A0A4Q7VL94_9BACT|nr:hypothetical protein [Ancylomarina subtilis]RZT96867.1 hypothetical protein EV201_1518 [Ancylomarina subtilis]